MGSGRFKVKNIIVAFILCSQSIDVHYAFARRVKFNKVDEILAQYHSVDKQGLLELNNHILRGEIETDITLDEIEGFLSQLEKTEAILKEVFKNSGREIKTIRFDFFSDSGAIKLNTKDAELTIFPNSALFAKMIKECPEIAALEEVGHLYTAPAVAVEYPSIISFLDVLEGKLEHPFLEGFNLGVDFSRYFKSCGGNLKDTGVIDSINEALNVKILIDLFGEEYKQSFSEENEAEFNDFRAFLEQKISRGGSVDFRNTIPVFAKFELISLLTGDKEEAMQIRKYAEGMFAKNVQGGFKEEYRSFYETLNGLIFSVGLKDEFKK